MVKRSLSAKRKEEFLDDAGSCIICGYDIPAILEVHHIVPLWCGGEDDSGNLVALCPNCHAVVERLAKTPDYTSSALFKSVLSRLVPGQSETLVWLCNAISGAIAKDTLKNYESLHSASSRIPGMVARMSSFVEAEHGTKATYRRHGKYT